MIITLSPQRRAILNDLPPTVSGEKINYRGVSYDFSAIPEDAEVQAESPAIGVIRRIDGQIHVTLEYFYNATGQLMQSTDPADYIFTVTSGACPDPIKRIEKNV